MEMIREVVDALRELATKFEQLAEDTGDESWNRAATVVHREISRNNTCDYTFAHTSHWCGNPACRSS